MFKDRYVVVLSLVAVLSAATSFAVGNGNGGIPFNSRPVTWEQFKERCADPDAFPGDIQRAPQNIKVQCTDIQREFVADAPGTVELGADRKVVTAVFADKFHVGATERDYPFATKPGTCLRYKEIEKTLTVERPLSCAEVLGIKGDINEYCASAVSALKGANPKLIDVRETGNYRDTCGSGLGGKK